jgi:hypothetical protein
VKVDEDDGSKIIKVYDRSVAIHEIVPMIIKKNRCRKEVPHLSISWSAIQSNLKTRSIDDIRNYWSLKLLPLLVPNQSDGPTKAWSEEDDIDLLKQIIDQDVEWQEEIDFTDISNDRRSSENSNRWAILLKGLGGVMPGQRVRVRQVATKMISDIETKHERYVPWADSRSVNHYQRSGRNQFINIVEYFKKNYM